MNSCQHSARIIMPHSARRPLPTTPMLLNQPALRTFEPETQVIQPLLPAIDAVHHASKCPVLRGLRKQLPCHEQSVPNCPGQPQTQSFCLLLNLLSRTDDKLSGSRRSGGAKVRNK